jgi:DNA-binding XRE family transcriptional regulator
MTEFKDRDLTPEQIKYLRYSILHLTQTEFAKMMGTCLASVNRWEKGRTSPVAMAKVIVLAVQQAVDNYGEQRIRGVDWAGLLKERGLLQVLAGIFNFATTKPKVPAGDAWVEKQAKQKKGMLE